MSTVAGKKVATGSKGSGLAWLGWLVSAAIVGVVAYFARRGAVSPRIANPEVTGVPRPVEFLFGIDWIPIHEFFTVVAVVALLVFCVIAWRRRPAHPYLLMTIAATAIVWRSEEHTSELQSLMRISYAVFCLKKKNKT